MNDLEIQLARAEQELLADETALHTELERLHGLIREFNARLLEAKDRAGEALSVKAIDTVLAESINRATLRPIDADGIGARAREAREAAVRARRDAANHLRHSITAWKSSYRAIEKQLSTDEKSVARAMASRVKPMAAPPALKALKPPARAMHEKPPPPIADEPPRITSLMYATQPDVTPPAIPALGDDEIDIQLATGVMFSQSAVPVPPAAALGDETPTHTSVQFGAREDRPRRSRPRVRMQATVKISSADRIYQGLSANISDGGIFVATENLVPLGTEVVLSFTLEGRNIESRGVVKWVRRPDERVPQSLTGLGVQFLEISDEARALVQRFVNQREPIFFDEI